MEESTYQVSRASVEIQELEQFAQLINRIANVIKEIAGQIILGQELHEKPKELRLSEMTNSRFHGNSIETVLQSTT